MMLTPRTIFSVLSTLLLACTISACGEGGDSNRFDPTDLPKGTATEGWGIGDQWYDYTFDGHKVSPRAISWVIRKAEGIYFVRAYRYYGDDGSSNKPTMNIRTWDGEVFGEQRQWKAESRMTDGHLCLTLADAETVSCDGTYDILWRTDKRPVPEIGWAPFNPGLYVDRSTGTEVYQLKGVEPPLELPTKEESISSRECATEQSIIPEDDASSNGSDSSNDESDDSKDVTDGIDDDAELEGPCETLPWRIESALDEDAQPLVPLLDERMDEKTVFQLTANLQLAQWKAEVDEENEALSIKARCVYAEVEAACSDPLDMPAQDITLDLATAAPWTFVSLCNLPPPKEKDDDKEPPPEPPCGEAKAPCITNTQDTLRAGTWPDTGSFDLVIQTTDENVRVWIAPFQPITVEDVTMSEDTTVPRSLWSIPGDEVCD